MRCYNPRRGSATVELAICLPVLLLIATGIVELCSMMFVRQGLTIAAYETAHAALQPAADSADALTVGDQILSERRIQGASVVISPSDIKALDQGEFFQVRVTAPSASNGLRLISLFTPRTLSAEAHAMKEVPAE